jgi:uncharacterized protein (TIGR01777 family)
MKHILITGASGMVGSQLIKALQEKGHEVAVLSRSAKKTDNIPTYQWDVAQQTIDPNCLKGIETIVHLAGENIARKKWTGKQKQEIIDSRVKSARLLHKAIKEQKANVKDFISASAVGYYGDSGDEILTEKSENGYGFLAECCKLWEAEAEHGKTLGLRIAKIRTGFVLSKKGGGLQSIDKPIRYFVGAPLGNGRQWVPWIHLDDLINIYIFAIENPGITGSYNACAPFPVTNKTLTKSIAKKLHRPCWPVHVPETVLNLALGEMSSVALMSTNTSAQKILETGFMFKYIQLDEALNDIYR